MTDPYSGSKRESSRTFRTISSVRDSNRIAGFSNILRNTKLRCCGDKIISPVKYKCQLSNSPCGPCGSH